jgi:uncharacterized SAM-binding protein YcdF (DUF218 family)
MLVSIYGGGQAQRVEKISFEKGYREYTGHRAWRQLVLDVADEEGGRRRIRAHPFSNSTAVTNSFRSSGIESPQSCGGTAHGRPLSPEEARSFHRPAG